MDYFQIKQDDRSNNAIIPQVPDPVGIWKSDKPAFFRAVAKDAKAHLDFLPLIEKPLLIVSDAVKGIFEMYQSKMLFKPCAIGSIERQRIEVYWLSQPRVIDCLDESTAYYPDGTLKEIILNKDKVGFNKIFKIDCLRGDYLIVDTEVLERLYREGIHSFNILPVKYE